MSLSLFGRRGFQRAGTEVKDRRPFGPKSRTIVLRGTDDIHIPEDVARKRGGRMGDGVEDTHGGKSSVGVLETLDKLNFALLDGSGDSC